MRSKSRIPMEPPVFHGKHVECWILGIEQYFELGDFSQTQKLHIVFGCLEDDALMWYRWERLLNPFINWEQMKHRVRTEFGTNEEKMVPPYSTQIVSHVRGSLKNQDPFVEQNQPETGPEEKTERIQMPLLVSDLDLGEQESEEDKKKEIISGEFEAKKRQEEEALTLGMRSSPIAVSGVVSSQIKGLENQPLEMKAIHELESEGKAETLSFSQHMWKPPEKRSKSMMQRGDNLMFEEDNGEEATVKVYDRDFIVRVANTSALTEKIWEMTIMIGSKVKIREGKKKIKPRNLKKVMSSANMVEEWKEAAETISQICSKGLRKSNRTVEHSSTSHYPQSGLVGGIGPNNNQSNKKRPKSTLVIEKQVTHHQNCIPPNRLKPRVWWLTSAEIVTWKAKRLSSRNDEKLHTHRKCSEKKLMLLIVQEDGAEQEFDKDTEEFAYEGVQEIPEVAECSLNSMARISCPKPMNLRGIVQVMKLQLNGEVTEKGNMLLCPKIGHSGSLALDNIESNMVKDVGCTHSPKYLDKEAPLERIKSVCFREMCAWLLGREVDISTIRHTHCNDGSKGTRRVLLGPGKQAVVIHGIQWLETEGENRVNWKLQVMEFQLKGQTVSWNGDPSFCGAWVSLKLLWKTCEQQGQMMLVENGGSYYRGNGVSKAVSNVNAIIGSTQGGKDPTQQAKICNFMVSELDGIQNEWSWYKQKLGDSSTLHASPDVCK
ncbi:hypothetical protein AALP_AAs46213U001000, partial [Arabis alpina]